LFFHPCILARICTAEFFRVCTVGRIAKFKSDVQLMHHDCCDSHNNHVSSIKDPGACSSHCSRAQWQPHTLEHVRMYCMRSLAASQWQTLLTMVVTQANYRAWDPGSSCSELETQTYHNHDPLCDVRSVLSAGPHTSKQGRRNSLEPFTSSRQP
jgi:hypothetical protein